MNCPHCQKPLPQNYTASFCPHCGGAIEYPHIPVPASPPLPPVKVNWFLFFAVLLAPPLLTLITAFVSREQRGQSVSPVIALFGGAIAGIVCGIMLARRVGRTGSARILLGFLFSGIFAVVCITLSLFGCLGG